MDAHERFIAHFDNKVFLLWQLINRDSDTFSRTSNIVSHLIDAFNKFVSQMKTNDLQCNYKMYFETLHTLLCVFYREKIFANKLTAHEYEKYSYKLSTLNVQMAQNVLCEQQLDTETSLLVQDILVLHMVLYRGIPNILLNLTALQYSIHRHLRSDCELKPMDIRVLDCYMDGLFLLRKNFYSVVEVEGEGVKESFLRNVQLWLTLKNYNDCRLLTSILPKLLQIITPGDILTRIWEMIFRLENNTGETLTLLCLTAEIWFPMESTQDKQLIERTTEEPFWLLLLKGLSSPIPQDRKQALYLIKRVVDFADKRKDQGLELGDYREVKPLLCTGNDVQRESFNKNLTNYFLVLEALEEKQKHLVTPVFPLLQSLLGETFDPDNQKSGLHIAWIRCAFLRILQHDNNAIVKWGLLNVFRLEPELFNDNFLIAVLHVLNTTFLYENDLNKEEPPVVKELARLFNYAETKNTDLVTRFVVKASKLTWGPVALFWVIHALSMVEKLNSVWKEAELEAVKSLAEINLTMHCRMLRIGSQIELLETVTHFATESLDLVTVANVLSVFSTSEALIRGQLAWKRTSAWLCKLVKKDEALRFLDEICGQMTNGNSVENISVKSFSLMIMLFHDGFLILDSKSCPGLTTLRNLLHCLVGADSRPYANTELRNRSIELIHHLLDFTSTKDCFLRQLITEYADTTLRMIFKNLRVTVDEASIDDINTNVWIIRKLFTDDTSIVSKREILNHVERFQAESWNIIEDGAFSNNVKRFFGIKALHACLQATDIKLRSYNFIRLLYDTYKIPMTQSSGDVEEANKTSNENRNLKGKIASEYYKFVAMVFHEYVQDKSVAEWLSDIDWIEEVSYLVQVGGKDIFPPLVGILSLIFYKEAVIATDFDDFKSAVRLCWKSTLESNECRLATEELIDLIFSSPFLECEETKELTIECTNEILDKGEKIPGLGIILLKGLKQVKGKYLSNFYDAILACLVCGTVPRRDQKIELQARSYVLDCYQAVYPNYLSNMNVNTSVATRAHAITLLHKMITDDPAHAINLLPLIVAKLDSSQNKRYFGDSQMHRLKTRLMQVLLVLQPALDQRDMESLNASMCRSILLESSQPSVRIMQEWLLIRIYLESDNLRSKIWDLFDQGQEKRVASLCSIISVVYHVARALSAELQSDFINLALEHIMPCCMSQQFNVRLYAQVIASKLYDLATELSYTMITEGYRKLYVSLTKSLKLGNLMKNSIKLQDDFYFTVFDPIDDYSLQTLFYELPRLSNVSSDEFILPQMFEKFGFKESNSHPLKLLNSKSDMTEAQVSDHVLKSSGSAGPGADDIEISGDCSTDIQKKFIPWKSMAPTEDELSEVSETLASRRKALSEGDNVILVASLIDKLPNLGGLSRTCEILGVKEFVVSSIKHTEDKEFQSLSVSAEKLINLVEVKPHQLQQYLLEKKEMGYQLVGAEQTVNSTNLMDMKFDKKTVLLLGNEKAGVPANLIPLLDRCVEIPQVGVVRSLNVHVTGAICLWEYFKQHYSP